MVIDTSAVLAILFRESEADAFLAAIGSAARQDLEALIHTLSIVIEPFTEGHALIAADAFDRYGKGRHPAALNLGDCCSYALAKATGDALLFKGGDFSRTDIPAA